MHSLIIVAAGNVSRMGSIPIPKALFPINGKPNIEWIIESARGYFDDIIIVARNGFGFHFNYLKNSKETPISILEISSGLGDGHAVLSTLQILKDQGKLDERIITIIWGDLYCPTSILFVELKSHISNISRQPIIVPVAYEKDPYVHFSIDPDGKIRAANFSKFGEIITEGLHDQSVFMGSARVFLKFLTDLHNSLWKDGKYVSNSGELNMLHIFHLMYNVGSPAIVHITENILSSYNSVKGAEKI